MKLSIRKIFVRLFGRRRKEKIQIRFALDEEVRAASKKIEKEHDDVFKELAKR